MDVQQEILAPAAGIGRAQWWPVALSERVGGTTPVGVICDGEPIVLFRDAQGRVRALEDRCRHRRAPLSLGRVTADGRLQCGYHGWTYDGLSGACAAIPHLSPSERVPSHYAARAYDVRELDGFVFVSERGRRDAASPQTCAFADDEGQRFHGGVTVSLPYDDYMAAFADGPYLLMRLAGLRITNYVSADPAACEGGIGMERGVVWAARRRNHRFVTEYPWTLRLAAHGGGATTSVELFTRDEERALVAHIGIAPATRGTTAVQWRGAVLPTAGGVGAVLLRLWSRMRRAPFQMLPHVDGHALARLERLYSPAWLAAIGLLRTPE